jgi:hypothetical protein
MNNHQYKNLSIDLPSSWIYENEIGDIEACFDPNSNSTFRIAIITAIPPIDKTKEEIITTLTKGGSYIATSKNYIVYGPQVTEDNEQNQDITLFQWLLIDVSEAEIQVANFSYTVLASEKDSEKEKQTTALLEESIKTASFK